MSHGVNIGWLNENRYRAYPVVEDVQTTLPHDVILDFQLLDYTVPAATVYLSTISISGSNAVFTFTYGGSTARTLLANTSASQYYPVTAGTGVNYFISMIIGPGIATLGAGTHTYNVPLEPTLSCFQDEHRVASIQALDDTDDTVLTGDIYLREGRNCKIILDTTTNKIRITAERGAGTVSGKCSTIDEDEFISPPCSDLMLRINGLKADNNGNFAFVGKDGVKIRADKDNHTVIFSANLSKDIKNCG